jgi:hypothetical protein
VRALDTLQFKSGRVKKLIKIIYIGVWAQHRLSRAIVHRPSSIHIPVPVALCHRAKPDWKTLGNFAYFGLAYQSPFLVTVL